jgi:hypothetical protein
MASFDRHGGLAYRAFLLLFRLIQREWLSFSVISRAGAFDERR